MQAFVPKNRKPKFDLVLRILDLTNVPLNAGTASVKWHLPSSNAAEHRGRTDKAPIREHKATWDYKKELPLRLTIEKTQQLAECAIHFEILQEFADGGRGGRVLLGNVKLNLAEYAHLPEHGRDIDDGIDQEEGGITRRYLLQDSKVNSTLKIGIRMHQTEGDTNFIPPPLKSAMVVHGIAGIVTGEGGEGEDMPSLSTKTRELSEAQDIYRRTLAATWACQAGELPPDKLIEDLFAGGDGGSMDTPPAQDPVFERVRYRGSREDDGFHSSSSDVESKRTIKPNLLTPDMARPGYHKRGSSSLDSTAGHDSHLSPRSGENGERRGKHQGQHHNQGRQKAEFRELTEFDLRDDLKSWQIRVQ